MQGIWLAAMVVGLVVFGVAAQLGWELRLGPLPRWAARRRSPSPADDFHDVS